MIIISVLVKEVSSLVVVNSALIAVAVNYCMGHL
jgi:hypothetical protein